MKNEDKKKTRGFDKYFSKEEIQLGIQRGKYFTGEFKINTRNRREGYVKLDGLPMEIMIRGNFQNRALPGDTVAFKILPTVLWWVILRRTNKEETIIGFIFNFHNLKLIFKLENEENEENEEDEEKEKEIEELQDQLQLDDEDYMNEEKEMEKNGGSGDKGEEDDGERIFPLMEDLRLAIEEAKEKQNETSNENPLLNKVKLPVLWQKATSRSEAIELIQEVLKHFSNVRPTGNNF